MRHGVTITAIVSQDTATILDLQKKRAGRPMTRGAYIDKTVQWYEHHREKLLQDLNDQGLQMREYKQRAEALATLLKNCREEAWE